MLKLGSSQKCTAACSTIAVAARLSYDFEVVSEAL